MTILEEKDRLRAAVLAKRLRMTATEKQKKDEILAEKLCSQPVFQQCQSIYVFLSKKTEVDTAAILRRCREEGKRVAAPHCVPGTRKMVFYWIHGPEDLMKGSFACGSRTRTGVCPLTRMKPPCVWFPVWHLTGTGIGWGLAKAIMTGFCPRFRAIRWGFAMKNACSLKYPARHGTSMWIN